MRRFVTVSWSIVFLGLAASASAQTATHLGCFADNQGAAPTGTMGRDLDGHAWNHGAMTVGACIERCAQRGFRFAGVQYGSWCFCGNAYNRHGPSTACTMPCAGNAQEVCGGVWANSVYRVQRAVQPRIAPQTPPHQGGTGSPN